MRFGAFVSWVAIVGGALSIAAYTYHQMDVLRFVLTRVLPAWLLVHSASVLVMVGTGNPPGKGLYLGGLLFGLGIGLPTYLVLGAVLRRRLDARNRPLPADLRQLEPKPPPRRHPVLDPGRPSRPGRPDVPMPDDLSAPHP